MRTAGARRLVGATQRFEWPLWSFMVKSNLFPVSRHGVRSRMGLPGSTLSTSSAGEVLDPQLFPPWVCPFDMRK